MKMVSGGCVRGKVKRDLQCEEISIDDPNVEGTASKVIDDGWESCASDGAFESSEEAREADGCEKGPESPVFLCLGELGDSRRTRRI
jgi:hypothetical protein